MEIDEFRSYCLSKQYSSEDTPFGPDVLAIRVAGKIFALCNFDSIPFEANLKCDPQWAVELREQYAQIKPGYHMNKVHWNTVVLGDLDGALCRKLIDHSYSLVFDSLTKKQKKDLE
jgi:predicted DNA-binding protein (MmcQ/YjbR family)